MSVPVAAPPPPPPQPGPNVIVAAPAVYAAPPLRKNAAAVVAVPVAPPVGAGTAAENTPRETKPKSSSKQSSSSQKSEKQRPQEKAAKGADKSSAAEEGPAAGKKRRKEKRLLRVAGQQTWEDSSLNEWDTDDFRIFCGDLGNDVTDEVLIRVFGKFPSFLKAKVIRDKRTNKSKGYGFASFKDPQDFIKAMREINGKYVGSRPIKLRKSTWRDRNVDVVRKKTKERERLGLI